jgi:methionine-rich copper-binding protein CopC
MKPQDMSRLILSFLVCISCALPWRMAAAHAVVVSAQPAARSVMPAGEVAVDLEFNSRIDATRSRLAVVDGKNVSTTLAIAEDAPANRIQSRTPTLTPGQYLLEWYVLSTDGHITRGRLKFEVAATE